MSRFPVGIAVLVVAILLTGEAQGGGLSLRGGPLGVVRSTFARLLPLGALHRTRHYARHYARHGRVRNAAFARNEQSKPAQPQVPNQPKQESNIVAAPQVGEAREGPLLGNPTARGQIVAAAALAGWHGGSVANGWWQHRDGGYGWVGPLFWPFAYDDIYDYTLLGDGTGFWDYGYADVYAGIFAPYAQGDLASYMGQEPSTRRRARVPSLQQFCGDDKGDTTSSAIDQIRQAVQPNDAQRAGLDDLAKASTQGVQLIRASCPTQAPVGAPARLAAMQERIEAIIKAELNLQSSLGKFYDLLDDEQKERFNALSENRRKTPSQASAKRCDTAQAAAPRWPADEIEQGLHPNDAQRAALGVLQRASGRASDMLKDACEEEDAITPTARLAAADRRLVAMLEAIKLVRQALDDLYGTLSDEQKAQFEAIGPKRTA
ncbi:Spy/CpxP family protein refolding chaperone [Bradyrhizobium sp. STM 3562]|uniref:Spy/CpxP family protein refolding chaperone n=1 Tax=Bradyrhizobium sp. STM 3562 TaxID=578924 RepID=UPI00388F4341